MHRQIFRPWDMGNSLNLKNVFFEKISYGSGMQIFFRESADAGKRFFLEFDDLPIGIRILNESFRLNSLGFIPKDKTTSFFWVENSDFLEWMNAESKNIYKDDPVHHLVIAAEEWIDILCYEMPKFIIDG